MGANERVAALRRARERQARIETATARTISARTSLLRAIDAKSAAVLRHDERVYLAEVDVAVETAGLARTCGSVEAAAEILGLSVREVRRIVKYVKERQAEIGGSDAVGN